MNVLAFDTETGGLDWFEPAQRAFLVTWADAEGTYYETLGAPERSGFGQGSQFIRALAELRRGDRIWGHNLKFDLHQVRAKLGFDLLVYAESHGISLWDTDSLSRILYPEGQRGGRGGHGLKELDARFGPGLAKQYDERLTELAVELGISLKSTPQAYWLIFQAYREEMLRYARYDARATYDLGENVLLPQLLKADAGLQQVARLERDVMPVIYLAEKRGVAVDGDQVSAFKVQFEREERELRKRLETELGGAPITDQDDEELILEGKGSTASLREALIKAGVPLTVRTDNGQLSTAKTVLAQLAPQYPVIDTLFEWRRVKRFLTTYIGPMVGRDVIHTDFQQQGPWTGRMASRRPNMQNWPQRAGKEVRNVLRARPGYLLAVADYAQMEAMIIVRYLNNPALIEAINNGLDMNAWMAAQIWGGEPYDWRKDGPQAEGERSRKTARHTLYATLYGAGAGRVTQQLPFLDPGPWLAPDSPEVLNGRPWKDTTWPQPGWQYEEARVLIRKVKGALPGYKTFLSRLSQRIDQVGYVTTIYGRRNPIPPDKKYVAVAGIVQGTGADILKLAAVKARRPLEDVGGTLVMFTHDELVAEVPEANAEVGLERLVAAMESAYPEHNPHLKASGHLVTHYGED